MKHAFTFILVLIASVAMAETIHVDSVITMTVDSTFVDPTPAIPAWKTVFTFENVLVIFAGLYEIAVRVFPTTKNLSALSLVYNIVNMIIPNRKTDGTKHK